VSALVVTRGDFVPGKDTSGEEPQKLFTDRKNPSPDTPEYYTDLTKIQRFNMTVKTLPKTMKSNSRALPQSHDEFIAWKDNLTKAKLQFLFKELLNPIRESVTEGRPPIHDMDGNEISRPEHIIMLEAPTNRVLADAQPLLDWENQKQRFNTKFWTPKPKKGKKGKANKGKISHDLMDKLYDFWDGFIQSYESDSKIQDTVKPSVKVFDFLKSSWREDLTIEDLRKIQLQV